MINSLEKAIRAEILKYHPKVYSETAPQNATFPYLVFSMAQSNKINEAIESIELMVDGWDKSKTPVALNNIMANLESLNGVSVVDGDVMAHFFFNSRSSIRDPENFYQHKRYTFIVNVLRKE